jgi:hypothetical protein
MPNTPVPAAATGLPSATASRRAFLGASIATALAGSPAAAAPVESPEFLALVRERAEARAAYDVAEAALTAARERGFALWPETPKTMRHFPGDYYERLGVLEEETDLEGKSVWIAEQLAKGIRWKGYRIPSVQGLTMFLEKYPKDRRARHFRSLLKRAQDLQRQQREAAAVSGYDKADEGMWKARAELEWTTRALADAEPRTMAGVLEKAIAMSQAEALCTELKFTTRQVLGSSIADDLVRLLRAVQ